MSDRSWTRWGPLVILTLSSLVLAGTVRGALVGRSSQPSRDAGSHKSSIPLESRGSVRPATEVAAERDPFRSDRRRPPRYQLSSEIRPSVERPVSKAPEFLVFGTVQADSCGMALMALTKGASPKLLSCGDLIGRYVLSEVRTQDVVVRDSAGNEFTIALTAPGKRVAETPSPVAVRGLANDANAEVFLDGVRLSDRSALNTLDPRAIERVEVLKTGGRSQIHVTTKK